MDAIIQNMFEINYSQLMQYEVLEKLVTFIHRQSFLFKPSLIVLCPPLKIAALFLVLRLIK